MINSGPMNHCQEPEMAWSFLWISHLITGMFFCVVVMFPVPIHIAVHNFFKNDSMKLSFLIGLILKVGSNWFNSSGSTTYCQKVKKDPSFVRKWIVHTEEIHSSKSSSAQGMMIKELSFRPSTSKMSLMNFQPQLKEVLELLQEWLQESHNMREETRKTL